MGFYISFPALSPFVTPSSCVTRRDMCRWIACWWRSTRPIWRRWPYRGKENQPAYTRDVADYLTMLKGVDIDTLAADTTQNFSTLFPMSMSRLGG